MFRRQVESKKVGTSETLAVLERDMVRGGVILAGDQPRRIDAIHAHERREDAEDRVRRPSVDRHPEGCVRHAETLRRRFEGLLALSADEGANPLSDLRISRTFHCRRRHAIPEPMRFQMAWFAATRKDC